MAVEAVKIANQQVAIRYSTLFQHQVSLLDANPFKIGMPLILGRYYTGCQEPDVKRHVWEQLYEVLSLDSPDSLYFKQSVPLDHPAYGEIDSAIYRIAGRAPLEVFSHLKWDGMRFFDIHMFSMTGHWALAFEESEEVLIASMGPDRLTEYLGRTGGLDGLESALAQDLGYLRSLPFWSRQSSLLMTWDKPL